MELLKTILDFIAKVAYPVILCIAFILFRKQLAGILNEFGGILEEVKKRRLRLRLGNLALDNADPIAVASLQEVQNAPDLASAAKTIQKLLSPAAPLALGYVKNFVEKMKKSESGIQIDVVEDTPNQKFETIKVFTIHIPYQLTDSDSTSTNLVRDKYPGAQIKNISIQSAAGRPFTGLAVLHRDRLYPVDVPQTVTSIRHVFKFREDQLKVEGKMKAEEIEKLENENLDEFANIIKKRIEVLQLSEWVRVIREGSELFPRIPKRTDLVAQSQAINLPLISRDATFCEVNAKDFLRLGVPLGEATRRATDFVARFVLRGGDPSRLEAEIKAIVASPVLFAEDPLRKEFAKAVANAPPPPRATPVKYRQWGEGLEHDAIMQMEKACLLPVSVAGALMPDAHVGYGLPIGGVLATENAVIPYAVGVDIACRMKMTVLDIPVRDLEQRQDRLARAIETETRFGVGANFKHRREHQVMDADWSVSGVTQQNKDRAWSQLGTSGSGNHFVEFGLFTAHSKINALEAGTYVALLSHSGSRGTGAAVCDHYSKLAFGRCRSALPSELLRLAWLPLDSQEGQEYWSAMELMGRYAAANHACIHRHIAEHLGAQMLLDLENHHNFAWKEKHIIEGAERDVIVHRKGATPAGQGVLGIIPGSMASPGFVVSGKGSEDSLTSCSHGAGRAMSRKAANEKFNWKDVNRFLRERGVTLISAGLDEVPMAYKNIREVMAAQKDLVTVLGQFDPKLVKMSPSGERPED